MIEMVQFSSEEREALKSVSWKFCFVGHRELHMKIFIISRTIRNDQILPYLVVLDSAAETAVTKMTFI